MTNSHTHDVIIIGVGQAGNPLARACAAAGQRVAVIERNYVGGTCVNDGCTPTKTMIASARIAHLARRAADYGVQAGEVQVDLAAVRQRKDGIVQQSRSGILKAMTETPNIDFMAGEGSFLDQTHVLVRLNAGDQREISAPIIVLDTGARSSVPRIPGLTDVPFLTSTTIMELTAVPDHLLILGGGYIGVEFAQMFRRFGAQVTLIQRGSQLLPREDDDIADAVVYILCAEGIDVWLESEAQQVQQSTTGELEVTFKQAGQQHQVKGSHLLVATGRQPNTEALNLTAAGVATDPRGFIHVDERLCTSTPGIYAAGDVNGGPAFTHVAYDDFRILRQNLLEGGNATTKERLIPYTVFTDPQLGRIGVTEREARQQGRSIRVAKIPMTYVARAQEAGESQGLMKAIVDAETDQILGAAILGMEGGELAACLQLAMLGGLPYTTLRDGVFAHPGLAEGFNTLFTDNWQR